MKLIATSVAAIAIGIVVALGSGMHATSSTPLPPAGVRNLTSTISVSPQLTVAQVAQYGRLGYDAIIDLRPDGEALDQPGSDEIAAEARSVGVAFAYVPVAPGEISPKTVAALDKALAATSGRVLIYCRDGERAARTWSLVEASRLGGRNAAAILAAVRDSGQSADDLAPLIHRRVADRKMPLAALQ